MVKDQATVTVSSTPSNVGAIVGFTLMNAETNLPISGYNPIANGAVINMAALPTQKVNIRANTNSAIVGSVKFDVSSNNGGSNTSRNENAAPYALFGDAGGNYSSWAAPGIQAGHNYQLAAKAYEASNLQGKEIGNLAIQFSLVATVNQRLAGEELQEQVLIDTGELSLYPNPVVNDVIIKFPAAGYYTEMYIYNTIGEILYSKKTENEIEISLPIKEIVKISGLYFIGFKHPEKGVEVRKILIL
jgi:hypothetical protein